MTNEQITALLNLNKALKECTDSGFFDELAFGFGVHPDIINRFCDAIEDVLKND